MGRVQWKKQGLLSFYNSCSHVPACLCVKSSVVFVVQTNGQAVTVFVFNYTSHSEAEVRGVCM